MAKKTLNISIKNYNDLKKNSTYKKLFNFIYNDLEKNNKIIDFGLDWLRLKSENINFNFEDYRKKNSTMGDASYITINDVDYLVLSGNSSMGKTLSFVINVNYKGFNKPVAIFRILKNRLNKNYIVDFYGLSFQLQKTIGLDIDYIKDFLFSGQIVKISRVDYNFNYNKNNQSKYIEGLYKDCDFIKNKNNYQNETITFGLYVKKGRDQDKVNYRLTTRFGFRLYNKTQNIYDLGIAGLYEQYEKKEVIRLEGVIGSDSCSDIQYGDLTFIEKQVLTKIIGKNKIIPSNNIRVRKKTNAQLEKAKLDLNSRIKTFIMNGGHLEDLESLSIYIDKKEDLKEGYF